MWLVRVEGEREPSTGIPPSGKTWIVWWTPRLAEILNRPFDGHVRAYGCWRRNSGSEFRGTVLPTVLHRFPSAVERLLEGVEGMVELVDAKIIGADLVSNAGTS